MSERLDLTKKSEKEHNCPLTWEEMDQNWTDIEKVTGDLGDSVDSINDSIGDINDSLKDINDRLDNIGEGGSVDLSSIKARVADVQNVPVATATVKVENNDTLAFSFGFQKGIDGKDGADGKDGIPGDDGLTSTTIFVFKSSEAKPARPVGGSWTLEGFIPPEGWTDSSDELDGIIWQSYATFLETGAIIKDWSEPVRITGNDGKNGVDGNSLEFIYRLTVNDYETPQRPISENTDDYVPSGWTDSPSGISSEYQVEWMCQREKTKSIWGDFTTPVIWSKWGADGRDGDGVEYVYKRTNTATPPEKPTDGEVNEDEELIPEGWTDNPTGVDPEYQWEWVSQRKYKNGVWSDFSNPALWAKYGEQGQSGYSVRIMYAKTDNSSIEPPFDASNINPGSLWGLIIPEHSGTEAVWGIQGTVTYDNQLVGEWTGPYLITGVAGQDGTTPNYKTFVFKNSDVQPTAPTGDSITPGDGWVDYPSGTGTWWMSVGEVNGTTGLVTSWSTPIRVNGKDGAGAVSIESISEEYGISKSYSTQPDSWEQSPVAPTEEYPYAWNKEIIHYSDSSTQDFTRVYATYTQDGRGITSVVNYYKLTESNIAPAIDESWSTVPTLPTDETPYLWGFERITYTDGFTEDSTVHIITIKSKDGASISNIKEQYGLSDGLSIQPSQWFDTPQTPTEENSFAWNKEIIEYNNGTSHELTPRIYAQYVTSGRGISSIQNYYKLTNTDTPPSIEDDDWGTIVQVPNETDKYLWNYEVITYTDSDTYSTQVVLLGTYAKDGGFYDLVGEEYGLSNSTDTPPTSWSSSIAIPTKSQRYGWIREKVVDSEGEYKYTTPRIYIWFTQDGVDGVGIESVVNLYRTTTEEDWNSYKDYTGGVNKVGYQYFLKKDGVSGVSIELFTAPQDPTSEFPILFGVEFITYTDGTTHSSPPHIISRYTESGADAPYTELRFKDYPAENISVSLTEEEKHERNISGWSVNMSELTSGQARWMISGVINPGEQLSEDGWQGPVRVSGEKGPQGDTGPAGERGPTGSQGVSGIPGVSIEVRYCLGTAISYEGTRVPTGNSPSGWSTSIPSVTSSKPYIWCIQGRRTYSSASDGTGTINWDTPFRLSGLNGLNGINGNDGSDGEDGKKGQLVYPAGIYSNTTSYTTDEYKAPYVLDPSDGNFYVLNAQMTWLGTSQGNRTPAQDYAQNRGRYWLRFDAFEAVYAKIGIIANGLIGSMVFNGNYVFSMQGINASGGTSHDYENFNSSNPMSSSNSFRPNYCLNCRTGEMWIGKAGASNFSSDGSGYIANGNISWDADGNITFKGKSENQADNRLVYNNISRATQTLNIADYDNARFYIPGPTAKVTNGLNIPMITLNLDDVEDGKEIELRMGSASIGGGTVEDKYAVATYLVLIYDRRSSDSERSSEIAPFGLPYVLGPDHFIRFRVYNGKLELIYPQIADNLGSVTVSVVSTGTNITNYISNFHTPFFDVSFSEVPVTADNQYTYQGLGEFLKPWFAKSRSNDNYPYISLSLQYVKHIEGEEPYLRGAYFPNIFSINSVNNNYTTLSINTNRFTTDTINSTETMFVLNVGRLFPTNQNYALGLIIDIV